MPQWDVMSWPQCPGSAGPMFKRAHWLLSDARVRASLDERNVAGAVPVCFPCLQCPLPLRDYDKIVWALIAPQWLPTRVSV